MPNAISYEVPSLIHLILSSFLYLLNVARVIADYALYAGIVADIGFGIVYGSPLAALLPSDWEAAFTALGYLGLILVVLEGGLSTNLPVLLSNLPLSVFCAVTGIVLPIALSFALLSAGFGYHPLESFAAGAALSSTSLGTILAALNSVTKSTSLSDKAPSSRSSDSARQSTDTPMPTPAGHRTSSDDANASVLTLPSEPSLQQSRIGTVLISAAIIDDVIGLVIASLIPALASIDSDPPGGAHGNLAWTIVRPLLASFLVAVVASIIARFVLRPIFWYRGVGDRWCAPARTDKPWGTPSLTRKGWGTESHADAVKLFLMVAIVSGMAAVTNYTGASVLYGAYVAGLLLTYLESRPQASAFHRDSPAFPDVDAVHHRVREASFEHTFGRTLGSLQNFLLLPLFFASIGFAIPFLDLWHHTVLWRGVIYSILMCIAKLAVGIPVLFYPATIAFTTSIPRRMRRQLSSTRARFRKTYTRFRRKPSVPPGPEPQTIELPQASPSAVLHSASEGTHSARLDSDESLLDQTVTYMPAAVFMGAAMVSRGEIGLLIAQLARTGSSQGDSSEPDSNGGTQSLLGDEAFLVCVWAILLCTLIGPISVGVAVRRWGSRITAGMWA